MQSNLNKTMGKIAPDCWGKKGPSPCTGKDLPANKQSAFQYRDNVDGITK